MKWHLSTTNNRYQYMCMWWTIGCTLCWCHWKKWCWVLVLITWFFYYEIFVKWKEVWAKMKLYKSSLLLVQMVWMFSKALYGVIVHIQEACPPFIWKVHCVFHWMNLVMHFFFCFSFGAFRRGVASTLNPYFCKISKHYLEPTKLAIMKIKLFKILKNLKIC